MAPRMGGTRGASDVTSGGRSGDLDVDSAERVARLESGSLPVSMRKSTTPRERDRHADRPVGPFGRSARVPVYANVSSMSPALVGRPVRSNDESAARAR